MSIGQPESCDTFVVLPPSTSDGCVIFAKNADRPKFEVQEVTYFPAADHDPASEKLQVGENRGIRNLCYPSKQVTISEPVGTCHTGS